MSLTGRSLGARGVGGLRDAAGSVPPTGLVLAAIASTQFGAAIAKGLFDEVGPAGIVFLRVAFAALVLLLLWRPRLGGVRRENLGVVLLFGVALGGMNLSFYSALDRIPLGITVTLEFVGPLGVAVAGSRRALDVLWVVLAGLGILLLAPLDGGALDPLGVALALLAGAFWAAYILLSARTGQAFPGGAGLAYAMCLAAVLLLPIGVVAGGARLLDPVVLLGGLGIALLSSAIPYSLELEALRRLPSRVFGVLMSIEPAVAALAGFLILREGLGLRVLVAIALVTIASVGASRSCPPEPTS